MNWPEKLVILSFFSLLLSCGIQEYYYLPQVAESNIESSLVNSATIRFPSIAQYYYATHYSIFYRIYISGETWPTITTQSDMNNVNPELARDFSFFLRYTENTSSSSLITNADTFKSRNYYEIELDGEDVENIFTKYGGTLSILFQPIPGTFPTVSLNGGDEIRLRRSGELTSPLPQGDLFFRNTPELNDNENATSEKNADVTGRAEITDRYTYVSMYIVARGYNSEIFSQIFGKPTHIHIFRLPDSD